MATVLGTLGFVMGLVAIWLAAEALRRIDGKSDELVRPQMREFKAQSARMSAMIGAIETRLSKLERRVRAIDEHRASTSIIGDSGPARPFNLEPGIPFAPSQTYDA